MTQIPQISEEHRQLLTSVIKECPKYFGHSELLDEFVSKTYQKSYLLLSAIKDMARLKRHLSNIAENVIAEVLKDNKIVDEQILYNNIKNNAEKRPNLISLKDDLPKQFKVSNEIIDDIRNLEEDNYYDEGQSDVLSLKAEMHADEMQKGVSKLDDPMQDVQD